MADGFQVDLGAQKGQGHLSKDATEIASRLAYCVKSYLATDKSLSGHFDGILKSDSGPDPAAS